MEGRGTYEENRKCWILAQRKMPAKVKLFEVKCKAAFTRQTKVGKLVLANSSWRV